jgi:hypothetical protein
MLQTETDITCALLNERVAKEIFDTTAVLSRVRKQKKHRNPQKRYNDIKIYSEAVNSQTHVQMQYQNSRNYTMASHV